MFVTVEEIQILLRIGLIGIIMSWAIVCRMIAMLIGNRRLSRMANKFFWAFIVVVVLRMVAAALETKFSLKIPVFTSVVTYLFHFYVLFLLVRLYLRLRNEEAEFHKTGEGTVLNLKYVNKPRLSAILDEMFDELRWIDEQTAALRQNLEQKLLEAPKEKQ